MKILAALIFSAFIISACEKEKEEPKFPGSIILTDHSYIFFKQGDWWIYDAKKIKTREGTKETDTLSFYRLDSLVTYTPDSIDSLFDGTCIVKTYIRPDSNEAWAYNGQYTFEIKNGKYTITENGTKFLKLNMPVSKDQSWDAYPEDAASLTYKVIEYQQKLIDSDFPDKIKYAGLYYVTVDEGSSENVRFSSSVKEKYAQNVGLIYKEDILFLKMQDYNFYEDSYIYKLIDFNRKF